MKRVVFAGAIFFLATTANAQLFSPLLDAPQHGFVVGGGIGPTSKDFSVLAGYADKLPGTAATYSYSGVSIVPAFVTATNGTRSLAITPVAHTGVKQIMFQSGQFTLALDGGAGVSMPSSGTSAFNFAGVAGLDLVWRIHKTLNSTPGGSNNYIALSPQFTQLTGVPGGTVVSLGISFVHGVNGQ